MGHKRLALEAGEDPVRNTMDYYLKSIETIYSIKHKTGAIRRVNINIAANRYTYSKRGRDRYLYPLPGDIPQGELSPAPSDGAEA